MENDEKKKCCMNCSRFKIRYINDYPYGGCVMMDAIGEDIVKPMEEVCGFHTRD